MPFRSNCFINAGNGVWNDFDDHESVQHQQLPDQTTSEQIRKQSQNEERPAAVMKDLEATDGASSTPLIENKKDFSQQNKEIDQEQEETKSIANRE